MDNQAPQRLALARRILGLTLREFAFPLDVTHSAVALWEHGTIQISPKVARRIELFHKISASWLLTGQGEMMNSDDSGVVTFDIPLTLQGPDPQNVSNFSFPLLSARPSAGLGDSLADYEGTLGHMVFDTRWLRQAFRVPPENLRLLKIDGDSMAPAILPNDFIFVDASSFQDFTPEGVWVLNIDGLLYAKRIKRVGPNQYAAASDNPAYSAIPLDESAKPLARVLGGLPKPF
jgi:phage repressor protein C with HTH and peptisase S24 domain